MKRLALGFIALVLSVGFSFGADVGPYHKAPSAPATASVYDWTGYYIGLNGGAGIRAAYCMHQF